MMVINIQAQQFSLTSSLRDYVDAKMRLMLGRYDNKIMKVNISLSDVNGPKGGEDKCCKTIVKVGNSAPIVIQDTAVDMYDAINRCARKARRAVKRNVRTMVKGKGARGIALQPFHMDEY